MPKLGDTSLAFVERATAIAAEKSELLPRSFDVQAMQDDLALFQALQPIRRAVAELGELLDDTSVAVGSDAYAAGLQVYNFVKADGTMDTTLEKMGRRFIRQKRKTKV